MNKKRHKIIFISGTFLVTSIFLISTVLITTKNKSKNKNVDTKYINIKIYGAILYPGEYSFTKGVTLKDILTKVKLLSTADISQLSFRQTYSKDSIIHIKYKKTTKFHIREIVSINQLIEFGIKKNIAIKIFNFLKSKNYQIT
jgi:hypothetical protein